MTQAKDIAHRAYEQALAAAADEQKAKDLRKIEEARQKAEQHRETFEAALPILNEWFPGVEWEYRIEGDYSLDTIAIDASESWPPSFKLKIRRRLIDMNEPDAGYKVIIEVGEYRQDSSMPGYCYFSGSEIKSAADLGRYLEARK